MSIHSLYNRSNIDCIKTFVYRLNFKTMSLPFVGCYLIPFKIQYVALRLAD